MFLECGVATWKVCTLKLTQTISAILSSRVSQDLSRRQARWLEFLQRVGKFKWDCRPSEQNVAHVLSRRDVATSLQDSVSVVKALTVCDDAVLSGMYDRSSRLGQAERLDCDQSCVSTLAFDLPASLLKFSVGKLDSVQTDTARCKPSLLVAWVECQLTRSCRQGFPDSSS
jgi:hypothetical protein